MHVGNNCFIDCSTPVIVAEFFLAYFLTRLLYRSKKAKRKGCSVMIIMSILHSTLNLKNRSQILVTGAADCHMMTPTFWHYCLLQGVLASF